MPSEAVGIDVGQLVGRRLEDAVGDARVEMGVAVEPGAEAVEEGDGSGRRRAGRGFASDRDQLGTKGPIALTGDMTDYLA
jgi:hypothetical protein